jgi:hypothetical protein
LRAGVRVLSDRLDGLAVDGIHVEIEII